MFSVILLLLSLTAFACQSVQQEQSHNSIPVKAVSKLAPITSPGRAGFSVSGFEFPYDLSSPVAQWELDHDLVEISGLTWHAKGTLGCIQDERGDIFHYHFGEKKTPSAIDFGKHGDYEGIEKVGRHYWVVRSDGRLYEVLGEGKKKKYDTFLDEDYDVEGLAYQAKRNRLLLACKGFPGKSAKLRNHKAVYAFDLDSRTLLPNPAYTINLSVLTDLFKTSTTQNVGKEIGEFFNPGKGNRVFQPSGIAVHPQTDDVYLVSHVGKLLLVFSDAGDLQYVEGLNPKRFPQPEGICFSPGGELFIASEGDGNRGSIARFKKK